MTLNPQLSDTSQSAAVRSSPRHRGKLLHRGTDGWIREGQSAERAGAGRERQDGNGKSAMQACIVRWRSSCNKMMNPETFQKTHRHGPAALPLAAAGEQRPCSCVSGSAWRTGPGTVGDRVLWLAARGGVLLVAEKGNNALQIHCTIGSCCVGRLVED